MGEFPTESLLMYTDHKGRSAPAFVDPSIPPGTGLLNAENPTERMHLSPSALASTLIVFLNLHAFPDEMHSDPFRISH